jgi:hypothetical protein
MRTINQMYKLLLKISDKSDLKMMGICYCITDLEIHEHAPISECRMLRDHFHDQRPSEVLHPEFYYKTLFQERKSAYWWLCTDEYKGRKINIEDMRDCGGSEIPPRTIRAKFIKHLIETTKDI